MSVFLDTEYGTLYQGDALETLRWIPSDSVDTMITDPPYGLSFMGKKWDYDVPGVDVWKECLRVLKPGATALIFAGSRTQHRMAVNVEDAGFILKDTIMWIYGSGFPKSTDISKQIDKINKRNALFVPFAEHLKLKIAESMLSQTDVSRYFPSKTGGLTGCVSNWALGLNVPTRQQWKILKSLLNLSDDFLPLIERVEAEREVIGKKPWDAPVNGQMPDGTDKSERKTVDITAPATSEAQLWNGWGTALKPAYEPILVAMKPNDGTYAQNALKHGVAGLHIDGGRIGIDKTDNALRIRNNTKTIGGNGKYSGGRPVRTSSNIKGRFPANIILDEEAGRLLDEQSGQLSQCGGIKKTTHSGGMFVDGTPQKQIWKEDKRGASRFFYCAKSSKSERGCENNHPTVKPIKLMNYLCNLTKTPTGGTVLDPFAGSGTTGVSCMNTGRKFLLIEKEVAYCDIITVRINEAWFKNLSSPSGLIFPI